MPINFNPVQYEIIIPDECAQINKSESRGSSRSSRSSKSSSNFYIIPIDTNKETLILIDWDDTLFPTTWITQNDINVYNDKDLDQKYRAFFIKLDMVIYKFLTSLLNYGKIFIITNAMEQWIEITKKLLPHSSSLFRWIKIISARDTYSKKYPNDVCLWKKLCFKSVAKKYMKRDEINNVISIGDANYEYDALICLNSMKQYKKYLKTIKLINNVDYKQLLDQLIVLNGNIKGIIECNKHLDLVFNSI